MYVGINPLQGSRMTEVLIVGAGPTGLTLALDLLRRGISVRCLDAAPCATSFSKALAIQARTLELFDKMGIAKDLLAKGLAIRQLNYHTQGYSSPLVFTFANSVPFPYVLILPQNETEAILEDHFVRLGGKVERNVKLIDVRGKGATLLHENGFQEQIESDWIVGCDGAHSAVRHALNLPFTGAQFHETFFIADVSLETLLPRDRVHAYLNTRGLCLILPLPEADRYRLIFKLSSEQAKEPMTPDSIQKLLEERAEGYSMLLQQMHWSSLFTLTRRIVSQMQIGNVFLAGDAAHIHSPAGGQGLNTSVQDALNLSWKLALVIKGESPKSLLKSYEMERYPVAKSVLTKTTYATYLTLFLQRSMGSLLFKAFNSLLSKTFVRKKISSGLGELDVHYPDSPIVAKTVRDNWWGGPKAGDRAPDVLLAQDVHLFSYLKDLRHVLLYFGNRSDPFLDDHIKVQFGKWVRLLRVSPSKTGDDILFDPAKLIYKTYHAKNGAFYLIRPDGYIAFRSKKGELGALKTYLEKIFWC